MIRIEAPVLDILRRSTVADGVLSLPPQQLDRKLYEQVNKVLTALGGSWNRKAKGHTFEFDPADVLAEALASGAVTNWKSATQFFETPPEIVAALIDQAELICVPDLSILEPSAGQGAIARSVASAMHPTARLTLLEQDERNRLELFNRATSWQKAFASALAPKLRDICILPPCDFLSYNPGSIYDRIIANPPFAKRADAKHLLHMWGLLAPGGILVSVASAGVEFRREGEYAALRDLIAEFGSWERLPEGSFRTSGTEVCTGIVRLAMPKREVPRA